MRSTIATAAALALIPIGSQAATMQDLFDGGSLTVDTYEVYDWKLDPFSYGVGDYTQIDVTIESIDYGFRLDYDFSGEMSVDVGDSIDIDFTYRVVDHGRPHFTVNWLELTDPLIDSTSAEPGYIAVQEDLFCGSTYIGSKYTEIDPLDGTDEPYDSLDFLCKDELFVEKHIELVSRGDIVELGDMHQGFIPAPATLALFGAGLIGLGWRRYRAR